MMLKVLLRCGVAANEPRKYSDVAIASWPILRFGMQHDGQLISNYYLSDHYFLHKYVLWNTASVRECAAPFQAFEKRESCSPNALEVVKVRSSSCEQ